MHIEFTMPHGFNRWPQRRAQLWSELRKWCYQHNLDCWRINTRAVDNYLHVELPSTKAYELFCISWRPEQTDLREYRLIRN